MTKREALKLLVSDVEGKLSSGCNQANPWIQAYYKDLMEARNVMRKHLRDSYDPNDHFGDNQTWLK